MQNSYCIFFVEIFFSISDSLRQILNSMSQILNFIARDISSLSLSYSIGVGISSVSAPISALTLHRHCVIRNYIISVSHRYRNHMHVSSFRHRNRHLSSVNDSQIFHHIISVTTSMSTYHRHFNDTGISSISHHVISTTTFKIYNYFFLIEQYFQQKILTATKESIKQYYVLIVFDSVVFDRRIPVCMFSLVLV